ncbi:Phosphocholine transferase AnkX [Pirellula sp. SH-Sr6A]|uniref:ankyrin repeat domain-containing protein n=1 Tax=Pirellula sp. SH-Sr6A TaxID=1632865 RepID=UPI00078E10CA|nr:ankyrin repeat domain-containing protein [Pirellula sp. SH-Sr6A]AMV34425.1 Phosphocholine transferase AnkX [Pirellula sp. SH-Sr6A]
MLDPILRTVKKIATSLLMAGAVVFYDAPSRADDALEKLSSKQSVDIAELAEQQRWDLLRAKGKLASELLNAPQQDGMTALHWGVRHGRHDIVQWLLDAGANPNAKTYYGVTPLTIACTQGDMASVRLLLDAKADATTLGPGDATLLMIASRQGNEKIAELLLQSGCSVNATERNGQTALMWAAAAGNTDVVKTLLASGADRDLSLKSGFNAFFFAVRQGHMETVDLFLSTGTDVNQGMNVRSGGGRNAANQTSSLILAVESGHFELALHLVGRGADPNDQRCGYAALHAISWVRKPSSGDGVDGDPPPRGSGQVSSLEFVRRLIALGADANLTCKSTRPPGKAALNRNGATPLLLACKTADLPLIQLLVELGADLNRPNADDCTPLLAAAGVGTVAVDEEPGTESEVLEVLDYLLAEKMDLHHVDKNGESAMHGAAYRAYPKVVRLLKAQGLKSDTWNHKNRHGWTPLDIADGKRPGSVKPNPAVRKALEESL